MEFANTTGAALGANKVRVATEDDAISITRLLKSAEFSHIHIDWKMPVDWIGSAGFVVSLSSSIDGDASGRETVDLWGNKPDIEGCLAVAADPPPAAWVRVAALKASERAYYSLASMMAKGLVHLRQRGVTELGWLAAEAWPESWLFGLGFEPVNKIETYWKDDLSSPVFKVAPGLTIRPAREEDLKILARVEKDAFSPLWRHSASALALARKQSISFDVALLDDQLVGFQLSVRAQQVAHLVRLTVSPGYHGKGIGSALLKHALDTYGSLGLTHVSLNTQVDNYASQHLYRKFGFYRRGERLPVWALEP